MKGGLSLLEVAENMRLWREHEGLFENTPYACKWRDIRDWIKCFSVVDVLQKLNLDSPTARRYIYNLSYTTPVVNDIVGTKLFFALNSAMSSKRADFDPPTLQDRYEWVSETLDRRAGLFSCKVLVGQDGKVTLSILYRRHHDDRNNLPQIVNYLKHLYADVPNLTWRADYLY